ncbi:histidine phosphatase family protein [Lutispora sp.]|uniref:histidine phosphatase family protein n=1 Tax=Lutispora sp. TaxID=2828727 RepID=UPI002B20B604|nr:histidine phosphatase family protein [Lutispora sp.]MEA4961399.1 histidine phosphatase family protein [Lutispora sp.]
MRLYLTRHGQTVWNIERRLQGWNDSELSEKGISNARALRERLTDIDFYEVYSSPVGRTMKTAEIVSGLEADKIIQDENLREIHLGSWEGRLTDEIELEYPEEYSAFRCSPHLYKRSDAESYYDVQKRALISVNNVIKKHGNTDRNILFVTHTVTLKTIMAYFEDREFARLWDPPFIYDTSLSMVEIKNGTGTIVMHGDISHFSDLKGYEFVKDNHVIKKDE